MIKVEAVYLIKLLSKVNYKIIFLFFSWVSVSSCGVLLQNDIYDVIPKGSRLDIGILKESRQIIPYDGTSI